jgi:hypothetical protein
MVNGAEIEGTAVLALVVFPSRVSLFSGRVQVHTWFMSAEHQREPTAAAHLLWRVAETRSKALLRRLAELGNTGIDGMFSCVFEADRGQSGKL